MKKLLSFLLFIGVVTGLKAQDSTSYYDLQQRIYSLPYYSYGKGLGFTSPDSIYQMNIRFRIQSRATFNNEDGSPGIIDGGIRRTRLRFDGYVGDPRFTYALQLSFAPGDLGGTTESGENIQIIRDAIVFYSINKYWSIGFGQTKLPGNRQRVNSSGGLQLSDRSINNALFNIDRDFGLQANYINQKRDKFSYSFKGAISQGEGRNFTENDDRNLAYTGKVELYPLGAFKKNGEFFEGDILFEEKPKLMLSAAYQYNDGAKKTQGQLGEYLFRKRDIGTLLTDVMFKYRGFSTFAAYMNRSTTDTPVTYSLTNPDEMNYVMAGQGFDIQSSYYFRKGYEIIGRYSWQEMHQDIASYRPDAQQYTVGLTKYIWEHAFKLQGEATWNRQDYFDNTQKNSWYLRFQVEIGI